MANAQQSVESLNEQANVQNESVQAVVEDFNQLPVIEAADSAPAQTQETGKGVSADEQTQETKNLFLQKMQRKNRSSKGKDNFFISLKNKHILITAGNRGGKKMDKLAKNQFILLLIRTILLQGTKLVFCLVWVSLLFMVGSI